MHIMSTITSSELDKLSSEIERPSGLAWVVEYDHKNICLFILTSYGSFSYGWLLQTVLQTKV